MNREWVLFHLEQAADALRRAAADIRANADYDDGEFRGDMQHIYHHINTAWSSRNADESEIDPGTDEAFSVWSRFPSDLDMISLVD